MNIHDKLDAALEIALGGLIIATCLVALWYMSRTARVLEEILDLCR